MSPDRRDEEYVADLLRSLDDDDFVLESPPAEVWAGIVADLGDEGPGAPTASASPAVPPATVTPLGSRRRSGRRAGLVLAVAAAAVVVLVLAGSLFTRNRREVELADATLTSAGLPNPNDLQGRAGLVRVGDRDEIDLDLPGLPTADNDYYEVWLLAPDGKRLQSLGITDGHGRYVVPTGIDPRQYPVVDVSREPPDGNPAHSGDSLVRGTLTL
jgi:anti-sigma-K factor RskA